MIEYNVIAIQTKIWNTTVTIFVTVRHIFSDVQVYLFNMQAVWYFCLQNYLKGFIHYESSWQLIFFQSVNQLIVAALMWRMFHTWVEPIRCWKPFIGVESPASKWAFELRYFITRAAHKDKIKIDWGSLQVLTSCNPAIKSNKGLTVGNKTL